MERDTVHSPTSDVDPIDVATAHADSPGAVRAGVALATTPELPAGWTDRSDDTTPNTAEVLLSAERLTATTEWTVSGSVRFRRRIVTSVENVEVVVRREELEVEPRDVADHAGTWVGTATGGPASPAPPVVTGPGVFVLREEVPDVSLKVVPYERVVVEINRVTEQVRLTDTARREQAMVAGDTGSPHPGTRT